jgi:hypothetical protein
MVIRASVVEKSCSGLRDLGVNKTAINSGATRIIGNGRACLLFLRIVKKKKIEWNM